MHVALLRHRITVSRLLLLAAFLALTVAVEMAFAAPLKLPGHRAFPGAFTILLAAESFAPLLLLVFAAAVPLVLHASGHADLALVAAWLVPAAALALAGSRRFARSMPAFVTVGVLFGVLRYLCLPPAMHHTPWFARLGGHVAFGLLAGIGARAVSRGLNPPGE